MSNTLPKTFHAVREVEVVSRASAPSIHTDLRKGDILIQSGLTLPEFMLLREESPLAGWHAVANVRDTLDGNVQNAGWTLFFMAGRIKTAGTAFGQASALRAALTRMACMVKAQGCNMFEITEVGYRTLVGISRVNISGHARHLQEGSVSFGKSK